jgi:putative membrane protein
MAGSELAASAASSPIDVADQHAGTGAMVSSIDDSAGSDDSAGERRRVTRGTRPGRPFFGQPIAWLGLSVALVMVPIAGWLVQSGWGWPRIHPALNAVLNGSSAVFLIAGGLAARRRAFGFHRQAMLTALTISGTFLVSYLIRFATTGAHRYPGTGLDKTIYLAILASHTLRAAAALPLVLRAAWLALRRRYADHRRAVRLAYPLWLYVSIPGVVVYLMLSHLAEP